jgi:putative endonuclease
MASRRNMGVHDIVYYEVHNEIEEAITREKQIKKWNRNWKLRLIEERNPDWKDLYNEIV